MTEPQPYHVNRELLLSVLASFESHRESGTELVRLEFHQNRHEGGQQGVSSVLAKFDGEIVNGSMHGEQCSMEWGDGTQYVGQVRMNRLDGTGTIKWVDGGVYEGEVRNGLRNGQGLYRNPSNGVQYCGEWRDGMKHGRGVLSHLPRIGEPQRSGASWSYDGMFEHDRRSGFGIMRYASGNVYEGHWENDLRHGKGTMFWADTQERYDGNWYQGLQHGEGRHIFFNLSAQTCNCYVGSFQHGKRNGTGTFYYADGSMFEGHWENNEKHGPGILTNAYGSQEIITYDRDKIVERISVEETLLSTSDSRQGSLTRGIKQRDSFTFIPLYIDDLLFLCGCSTDYERIRQLDLIQSVVSRHSSTLRRIFDHYAIHWLKPEKVLHVESATVSDTNSRAAAFKWSEVVISKTSELSSMQFWKFAQDCGIFRPRTRKTEWSDGLSVAQVNRIIFTVSSSRKSPCDVPGVTKDSKVSSTLVHAPSNTMRFRDFAESIVRIALVDYGQKRCTAEPFEQIAAFIENVVIPACDSGILEQTHEERHHRNTDSTYGFFLSQSPQFKDIVQCMSTELSKIFLFYSQVKDGVPHAKAYHRAKHRELYNTTMSARQFINMFRDANLLGPFVPLPFMHSIANNGMQSASADFKEGKVQSSVVSTTDQELIFDEFVDGLIRCSIYAVSSGGHTMVEQVSHGSHEQTGDTTDEEDKLIENTLRRLVDVLVKKCCV